MKAKFQIYALIFLLVTIGGGLTIYKVIVFGFPLVPGKSDEIWTVEAKISFNAQDGPVNASFFIPDITPGYSIYSENFASTHYGFTKTKDEYGWRANWHARKMKGPQTIYYRVQFFDAIRKHPYFAEDKPEKPKAPFLEKPYRTAANTLIQEVRTFSADILTFTEELLKRLNSPTNPQYVSLLFKHRYPSNNKAQFILDLLARAKIPARIIKGLYLEDGLRNQPLLDLIQVYDGSNWIFFNPVTGKQGRPEHFFIWQKGGKSLLDLEGGKKSKVSFSIIKDFRTSLKLATHRADSKKTALIDFSIYSLPIEKQNMFKLLLLVPIGALVVVVMNNLVGLPTSGTFMPILIAMSFKQTDLLPGLFMFCIIVGAGLQIRTYLSHLNLLFVPRISAVVIVVVLLMAGMSIVSVKLDIRQGLTITFFPMIILAWTIERISIMWEEQGCRSALTQAAGSLLVASISYLIMSYDIIEHLTFTFPELVLVILAIILLIGNYRGYRLSELSRFKHLIEE